VTAPRAKARLFGIYIVGRGTFKALAMRVANSFNVIYLSPAIK
jgi:hypothetical protein